MARIGCLRAVAQALMPVLHSSVVSGRLTCVQQYGRTFRITIYVKYRPRDYHYSTPLALQLCPLTLGSRARARARGAARRRRTGPDGSPPVLGTYSQDSAVRSGPPTTVAIAHTP